MNRSATAKWQGHLKNGKGSLSTDSGILQSHPYSFNTRFGSGMGTNPEELIAAAHAGCFSMALAAELERVRARPCDIETTASVNLTKHGDSWSIDEVHLTTLAPSNPADRSLFEEAAQTAKANCPVSKLLNASITLEFREEPASLAV